MKYITTPIYYLNGEPHLGHYYATTIADVLARYYRKYHDGVFFLTGTDEHGQKVADKAASQNLLPQEFTDTMSQMWQKTWQDLGISYDYFIRTTNPKHQELAQYVIERFRDSDDVYLKEYEALYCVGAESFVTKSELREGGLCPDHDEKPQIIQEKNYFFRLSKYKSQIRDLIINDIIKIVPESRKNETLELLNNPDIDDFSVTRQQVSWGVPVPFDDTQTLYVWIDALFNYMSGPLAKKNIDITHLTPKQIIESIVDIWPPNIQIIGKDIMKFHTVFWPAFLLALGIPEDKLPKTIVVTGFFMSDGRKMSKSLGNVINPQEIIQEFNTYTDNLGNDILRYIILREMKIGNDGDLTLDKIEHIYHIELVNKFGNTFSRVMGMAKKYQIEFDLNQEAISYKSQFEKYHIAMQDNDIYSALHILLDICSHIAQEIQEIQPWELYKQGNMTQLQIHIREWIVSLKEIAKCIEPIMPRISDKMQQVLAGESEHIFPQKPLS